MVEPSAQEVSFKEAILDMGRLFKQMKRENGIPPSVTMDIVRLQMLYMQQHQEPQNVNKPLDPNSNIDEVIEGDLIVGEPDENEETDTEQPEAVYTPTLSVVPDPEEDEDDE